MKEATVGKKIAACMLGGMLLTGSVAAITTATVAAPEIAYAANADSLGKHQALNRTTVSLESATAFIDNKATAEAGKTKYNQLDSIVFGTNTKTIKKGVLADFQKKTGAKCMIVKSSHLTTQASVNNCMKGYTGKVFLDFRKQHSKVTFAQAKKVRNAFLKYAGADKPTQIVLLYN